MFIYFKFQHVIIYNKTYLYNRYIIKNSQNYSIYIHNTNIAYNYNYCNNRRYVSKIYKTLRIP